MRQIKFRTYVRFLREMHEVREMIVDKGTVMIGYSGTSENVAKDALMSQAFNQLRTNILGEDYERC